jgi:glutathione S-transferase
MKLYYAPGACSLAPHIALREAGIDVDLEQVDLGTKRTASGEDYTKVNPKGYVPALGLDDAQVLTEVAAVLQYVADQRPASRLAPKAAGSMERYRLAEWLTFVSSEIHKSYGPLWKPDSVAQAKQAARDLLGRRFDYLEGVLGTQPFLMGEQFTIADAYLFTVLNWTRLHDIDIEKWPHLSGYVRRIAARPAVQAAMKAEGLAK